jgi:acetoin utilization deacetylase AcuC-like enzyme
VVPQLVNLPLSPQLTDADADYLAESVEAALARLRPGAVVA